MMKLVGNVVIVIAGMFVMAGGAIAVAILFTYAFCVVMLRRILRRPIRPALTA